FSIRSEADLSWVMVRYGTSTKPSRRQSKTRLLATVTDRVLAKARASFRLDSIRVRCIVRRLLWPTIQRTRSPTAPHHLNVGYFRRLPCHSCFTQDFITISVIKLSSGLRRLTLPGSFLAFST